MTAEHSPKQLYARSEGPLTLAAHGGIFVGARTATHEGQRYATDQIYVEYFVPQALTQPWPIVMIHGGGSQGLDFLRTPDGREGWAYYFVRRGFCVYVLDRTGSGRAAQHGRLAGEPAMPTPYEAITARFSDCARHGPWPAAARHTQWPGDGTGDDPAVQQFAARLGPSIGSLEASHRHAARLAPELFAAIGPAILITHSLGACWGWILADTVPSHVPGILAVEPFGPPFAEHATGGLRWGLTATPPTRAPTDLAAGPATQPRPPGPKRPSFSMPIGVVTAEASWQAHDGHRTVEHLRAAGAEVDHIRLADRGIHGNGHAPMLEANSSQVAAELLAWLVDRKLAN